eukprot:SAG31_NODE_4275_length_3387_cov_1.686740_3_plen_198_part_00
MFRAVAAAERAAAQEQAEEGELSVFSRLAAGNIGNKRGDHTGSRRERQQVLSCFLALRCRVGHCFLSLTYHVFLVLNYMLCWAQDAAIKVATNFRGELRGEKLRQLESNSGADALEAFQLMMGISTSGAGKPPRANVASTEPLIARLSQPPSTNDMAAEPGSLGSSIAVSRRRRTAAMSVAALNTSVSHPVEPLLLK